HAVDLPLRDQPDLGRDLPTVAPCWERGTWWAEVLARREGGARGRSHPGCSGPRCQGMIRLALSGGICAPAVSLPCARGERDGDQQAQQEPRGNGGSKD